MTAEGDSVKSTSRLEEDTYARAFRAHGKMTCLVPGCCFCTNFIKDEIDAAVAAERNLHDELVAALRRVVADWEKADREGTKSVREQARAVLAKAKP